MEGSVAGGRGKVQRLVARGLGLRDNKSKPLAPSPKSLLLWYDRHRRILPWRALAGETPDPYRVWLSEIMLQQTTVAAVGPYFQKFVGRWPTLRHLAKAKLDDVLRAWAGLGYYRRARMLHECARMLRDDYDGQFPQTPEELQPLPGFGPYTAAAVAAIAFDRPANVVDGNVERVIARVFAVREPLPKAKAELRALAATLLPEGRHGDYAQALMDLGATLCTPRNPKCDLCPWSGACKAKALGIAEDLPRRNKPAVRPVRRALAFVLFNKKGKILLRRRAKDGLLGGMMEIPSSAWREGAMPGLAEARKAAPAKTTWHVLPGMVRHVFTHFELQASVAIGTVRGAVRGHWVAPEKLADEALPSVMLKIARYVVKHVGN